MNHYHNSRKHEQNRIDVNDQITEFFANGGTVEHIEQGVTSDTYKPSYGGDIAHDGDTQYLRDKITKIDGFEDCLVYHKKKTGFFCKKTTASTAIPLGKTFDEAKKKASKLISWDNLEVKR